MSKDTSREDSSDSGSSSGSGSGGSNTTAEWRTGYIQGNTFHNKEVKYRIINGVAIFEGDIILASTPEEIERLSPKPAIPGEHEPSVRTSVKAVVRRGDQFRWPRGEIPYIIQP